MLYLLHASQQEVENTVEYSVFEYLLRPTYDFCQELLSHGVIWKCCPLSG